MLPGLFRVHVSILLASVELRHYQPLKVPLFHMSSVASADETIALPAVTAVEDISLPGWVRGVRVVCNDVTDVRAEGILRHQ